MNDAANEIGQAVGQRKHQVKQRLRLQRLLAEHWLPIGVVAVGAVGLGWWAVRAARRNVLVRLYFGLKAVDALLSRR
ncbi:MAG TPA: hypothetical protein VKZ49_11700 [Polyangiaceae bacterium]|nr:hypothetical protein [Polyangiaceae bacterium]